MSVYHQLVTLVCVAIVVINASAEKTDGGCCFPHDAFSVNKGGVIATTRKGFLGWFLGQTSLFEEHDSVYDFGTNRFAAFITRMIQDPYVEQHVQVIELPGEDYVWVIDLDKQTCLKGLKEVYPFHLERCIPDYMTYADTYYAGSKQLLFDGYYAVFPKEYSTHGIYSISVTRDCLPYSETFVGETNSWKVSQNVASTLGYYNYTVGIETPEKYFTVPDYCQNEEEKSIFSWW